MRGRLLAATLRAWKQKPGFSVVDSADVPHPDLVLGYPTLAYPDKAPFLRLISELHTSVIRLEASTTKDADSTAKNTTETKAQESQKENDRVPLEARPIIGNPVSWLSFGLLVATGAGIIFYFGQEKSRRIQGFQQQSMSLPEISKVAIGGPFQLVTHDGKEVTEKDLKGSWNLIYFGFTHCPDICPKELQKMVEAIDLIEKKEGIQINPVFVSVDPERDNIEQLRQYVKEFHPRLLGLTGSMENIRRMARQYRVYYMKTEDEGTDYLVDHSIIMYLMDPQMEFVNFFGNNYDVDGLVNTITDTVKRYKIA